jgi:type I restriction enzyme M protein
MCTPHRRRLEKSPLPRSVIEDKEKKIKEMPDLVVARRKFKMDLLPPTLIAARFFADDAAKAEALRSAAEAASSELEEFLEENGGDEGLLSGAADEDGKITKAQAKDRIKILKEGAEDADERAALEKVPEAHG